MASNCNNLDEIDRQILIALQNNGRLQNLDLAKEIGLSPLSCLRRVRRLEEQGIIERYAAVLNAAKIGKGLTVFVRVWLEGQDLKSAKNFTDAINQMSQVVECHLMDGDCDFLLRVIATDLDDYLQFQKDHLARIRSVQRVKSEIPMQKLKFSSEIPV